jgi:hypothetical protein
VGRSEYTIQGRTVKLPLLVRDAGSISATFLVPTNRVRRLIGTSRIEVAELFPGRTLCTIVGIEYRDNDLGSYNEVGVVFFVRSGDRPSLPLVGTVIDMIRGRLGAYIHQLPVTTSLSCAAGREIWGFPKFEADIEFSEEEGFRVVRLAAGGEHILTLAVRPGRSRKPYPETNLVSYSGFGGIPRRTPFVSSGEGASFRVGGARLELGSHRMAEELRSLGLPKRALAGACVEHMRMRFEAAQPI